MIRFPPYQTTARVVTFMANIITGMVAITIFNALIPLSLRSWLRPENFPISKSSRTKDLTTRTLVKDSWIPEFSRSSFFCMASNRGKAVFKISPMARERRGITTSRIAASLPFIIKAINNAPTNIPGARRAIFKPMVSTFCTCWISLVRRVTREPVLKLSMLAKENCWTFLNTSLRRSVVKFMDAFAAK